MKLINTIMDYIPEDHFEGTQLTHGLIYLILEYAIDVKELDRESDVNYLTMNHLNWHNYNVATSVNDSVKEIAKLSLDIYNFAVEIFSSNPPPHCLFATSRCPRRHRRAWLRFLAGP